MSNIFNVLKIEEPLEQSDKLNKLSKLSKSDKEKNKIKFKNINDQKQKETFIKYEENVQKQWDDEYNKSLDYIENLIKEKIPLNESGLEKYNALIEELNTEIEYFEKAHSIYGMDKLVDYYKKIIVDTNNNINKIKSIQKKKEKIANEKRKGWNKTRTVKEKKTKNQKRKKSKKKKVEQEKAEKKRKHLDWIIDTITKEGENYVILRDTGKIKKEEDYYYAFNHFCQVDSVKDDMCILISNTYRQFDTKCTNLIGMDIKEESENVLLRLDLRNEEHLKYIIPLPFTRKYCKINEENEIDKEDIKKIFQAWKLNVKYCIIPKDCKDGNECSNENYGHNANFLHPYLQSTEK